MEVLDNLNTYLNYIEIIQRQDKYIQEEESDLKDYNEIEDKEKIDFTNQTIFKYSLDNIIASYSDGSSMSEIRERFIKSLASFAKSWKSSTGYVQMVQMLSMGIMLEIEKANFDLLINMVKQDNPNDYLIDTLISYREPDWEIHDSFNFPNPYKTTKEIVDISRVNKQKGLDTLRNYLQKDWYKGHSDTGWYNSHKSKWNIYTGYWSFESGALVKILGLDDSSLKNQTYYPYDMVHEG